MKDLSKLKELIESGNIGLAFELVKGIGYTELDLITELWDKYASSNNKIYVTCNKEMILKHIDLYYYEEKGIPASRNYSVWVDNNNARDLYSLNEVTNWIIKTINGK